MKFSDLSDFTISKSRRNEIQMSFAKKGAFAVRVKVVSISTIEIDQLCLFLFWHQRFKSIFEYKRWVVYFGCAVHANEIGFVLKISNKQKTHQIFFESISSNYHKVYKMLAAWFACCFEKVNLNVNENNKKTTLNYICVDNETLHWIDKCKCLSNTILS